MFHKKRDNLLLEADIFYHFRGIILCNAKRLQFHRKEEKNNIGAQFSKSSIPLHPPFFNSMELLVPFALHKNIPQCDGSIVILIVAG